MNNRPWAKLFASMWAADQRILAIKPMSEFIYFRLWIYCWMSKDCSLSADFKVLSHMARVDERTFIEHWDEVKTMLVEHPLNKSNYTIAELYNLKLEFDAKCESARLAGITSGKIRRNNNERPFNDRSTTVRTTAEPLDVDLDVEKKEKRKERSKSIVRPSSDDTESFNKFWTVYPKKQAKQAALKVWTRKKLSAKVDEILSDIALRREKHAPWQDRQFIPMPATYLNGERWLDEIEVIQPKQQREGERDEREDRRRFTANLWQSLRDSTRGEDGSGAAEPVPRKV